MHLSPRIQAWLGISWAGILAIIAVAIAIKPEFMQRHALREADRGIGSLLRVREKVEGPEYLRRTRLSAIAGVVIATLMLAIFVYGYFHLPK